MAELFGKTAKNMTVINEDTTSKARIVCEFVQSHFGGVRKVVVRRSDLGDSILTEKACYFLGCKYKHLSTIRMKEEMS